VTDADYGIFREYLRTAPTDDTIEVVESVVWTTKWENLPLYISHPRNAIRRFVAFRLEVGV